MYVRLSLSLLKLFIGSLYSKDLFFRSQAIVEIKYNNCCMKPNKKYIIIFMGAFVLLYIQPSVQSLSRLNLYSGQVCHWRGMAAPLPGQVCHWRGMAAPLSWTGVSLELNGCTFSWTGVPLERNAISLISNICEETADIFIVCRVPSLLHLYL